MEANISSKLKRSLYAIGVVSAMTLAYSPVAEAGAYHLFREYNAVDLGNSGAGGAAIAEDASTAYANPAGLTRLKNKQVVASADFVFAHARFKGTNTWSSTNPLTPFTYTQTGTTSTNQSAMVPALYYSMPLNYSFLPKDRDVRFALGVSTPFGLSTRYPTDSLVRYSGTFTKLIAVDFSPSIAFKLMKNTSFGIGADFVDVTVDQRSIVGVPLAGSMARDSLGKNTGDGWAYGGHLGFLYKLREGTRFGFAYHSFLSTRVEGKSVLKGPILTTIPTRQVSTDDFNARIRLPSNFVLSGHHEYNDKWTFNGTVMYTEWSRIGNVLTGNNLAGLPATPPATPTKTTSSIEQFYRNTWTLALGGSYILNPTWKLRGGVSYDQSPIKSKLRNVTLPDANKVGVSVGFQYRFDKQMSVDAGYTHLFIQDVNVSHPRVLGSQTSVSNGKYDESRTDLLGIQLNYDFA